MKPLIFLLPFVLCSCEVMHRPGIVVRDKVAYTNKYGPGEKMQDVLIINGDVPGLSEVPTPMGPVRIAQVSGQNEKLIISGTTVLGVEKSTILGGLFVTDHVRARGEADKSRIKEVSAGVSGAIVSGAGAALVGPGLGAIPK